YKLFHANACPLTNQWAADLIGRRRMNLRSCSVNHPPYQMFQLWKEEPGFSTSLSEAFEYPVMPHVFSSALRKGGPPHMETDAILFGGGRRWHGSDETYLSVTFKQGF
ncbi:MAG: hypothetical protein AB7O38_15165, partial [Pirellulaceae bacterium]